MVKRNIVASDSEQQNIFQGLIDQMVEQGKVIPIVQTPNAIDPNSGTTLPQDPSGGPENNDGAVGESGGKPPAKPAATVPGQMMKSDPNQSVTSAVANQGQLIPIQTQAPSSGGDNSDIKKLLGQVLGNQDAAATPPEGGKSGGGGNIIGDIASVATAILAWIICTELMRQGKMPRKWWIKGAPVFAAYPDFVKQGYYLWAIPCVGHLRRSPNSALSRFLCLVFNWRAQSIAEKTTFRGLAVTAILWPICWALGFGLWLLNKRPDWTNVYRTN